MRFFIGIFIVLLLFLSCTIDKATKIDVSNINVNFSVERFDVDFYTSTKENLSIIKNKYPFFFPKEECCLETLILTHNEFKCIRNKVMLLK